MLPFKRECAFVVRDAELLGAGNARAEQGISPGDFGITEFAEILFGVALQEAVGPYGFFSCQDAAEVAGVKCPACHLVLKGIYLQGVSYGSALEVLIGISRHGSAQGSERDDGPVEQGSDHQHSQGYEYEAQPGEPPELDPEMSLVLDQREPVHFIPIRGISFSHIIRKFAPRWTG